VGGHTTMNRALACLVGGGSKSASLGGEAVDLRGWRHSGQVGVCPGACAGHVAPCASDALLLAAHFRCRQSHPCVRTPARPQPLRRGAATSRLFRGAKGGGRAPQRPHPRSEAYGPL